MLPNEVKPYSESYQYLWKHRKNYQEFRFAIMNMMVDDAYDKPGLKMIEVCSITKFTCLCSKGAEYCKQCGQQETPLILIKKIDRKEKPECTTCGMYQCEFRYTFNECYFPSKTKGKSNEL